MSTFSELVAHSRSIRRFDESQPLSLDRLAHIAGCLRNIPCGGNAQTLKFCLVADKATCAGLFPLTKWAAYYKDWPGPAEGERPTGYVIALNDTRLPGPATRPVDLGIAAQTLALSAAEDGLGCCLIQSFNKEETARLLSLPDYLEPMLVAALGVPAEKVIIEPLNEEGSIVYFRGENGSHHVPKRPLEQLLILHQPE